MNQGSYGVTPAEVTVAAARHRATAELCPDDWFRRGLYEALDSTRARIARYVNAPDPDDIVFVDNASSAVNAVLRSLRFESDADACGAKRPACLLLNISYPMTKHAARYASEVEGRYDVQTVNVPLPSSDDEVVALIAAHLDAHPEVRIAEVSHITSIPSLILPVKRIAEACRRRGVLSLIDGMKS